MPRGAVEVVALSVPAAEAGRAVPRVVEELRRLAAGGTIALLDALYVVRSPDGAWRAVEVQDDAVVSPLGELLATGEGRPAALLSTEDAELVGTSLEPGTSAVVVAYEHTWAKPLRDAVHAAGGAVALQVRIPPSTVEAAALARATA